MSRSPYATNDDVAAQIGALAAAACFDLFGAYGVRLTPATTSFAESNQPVLCSATGFVGPGVRGTCLLAGHTGPLQASCPQGGRVRDWMGELANQLVGRLKSKLLTYGLELAATTPVVLSGIRLEPVPRGALAPAVFSSGSGSILVWIEIDTTRGFSLLKSVPPVVQAGS